MWKLSSSMEQALLGSTTVGGTREIMDAGPATKRGLARRLLVEPGTWKLTEAGEAERKRLIGELPRVAKSTTTLPIADGTGQPAPVYGHKKLDGAIDPATTPLGRPVGDFQVKIWYASGSSEVISHIDFMSAAAIYSEALDRERAIAAEVHCPGGCLAATFTREVDSTGNRG
jgi:hypothetical protein